MNSTDVVDKHFTKAVLSHDWLHAAKFNFDR